MASSDSNNNSIRLGDVVVSIPHQTFGGIIQYDLGKAAPGGSERTGSLNSPPQILLEQGPLPAEGIPMASANNLEERCRSDAVRPLDGGEQSRRVPIPNATNGTTAFRLPTPSRPARQPAGPEVHHGLIASGDRVMSSAAKRNATVGTLGDLVCFEMEGAGIADKLPCIVTRGVADYADSHKNDSWQHYAAADAAAYAKSLLSYITPEQPLDDATRHPIAWSPSETSLRGIRCYEVPGTINGVPVDALPDWGSPVDAVSEDFARHHGLRIKAANSQSIPLLGGHIAESVGRIVGHFKFRGERDVHRREFHVLRKSVYDLVLGRKFLNQTKTLTEFCHRIVERARPCVQKGSRLFLLDESPKDRLRCAVNGTKASAIPDTGSELMLVSGDFTRRNNLTVRRGRGYRRRVELIDGSTIYTDGMVLNAELQFDASPISSRELDYDQYIDFTASLSSLNSHGTKATTKATFICDFHVIEDLPCDIILSNEFIFENQVFSRFKSLFYSKPTNTSSEGDMILDDGLLFIRCRRPRISRLRQLRQPPQRETNIIPLQGGRLWEERWKIEEERRNQAQLRIASLAEPHKSVEQRNENQRRADWDRNNPRPAAAAAPPPSSRPISTRTASPTPSNTNLARTQVPGFPSPAVLRSVEDSARSINSPTLENPDVFLWPRLPGNV